MSRANSASTRLLPERWLAWWIAPLAGLGLAGLYLAGELVVAKQLGFSIDDTWIHLVFARNIARGCGFAFNCGVPVAGSTSPLWTLLLAPLTFLPVPMMIVAVKVLGVIVGVAVIAQTRRVGERLFGGDRGLAALTGWLVLLAPGLAHNSLSGMEAGLFALIVLLGIELHLRARTEPGRARWLRTAVFALGVYTRPEGLPLAGWCWLDELIALWPGGWRARRGWLRRVAGEAVLFAALLAPYFAFNYATGGTPFPITFAAKVGDQTLAVALREFSLSGMGDGLVLAILHVLRLAATLLANLLGAFWLLPLGLAALMRRRADYGLLIPLIFFGAFGLGGVFAPDRFMGTGLTYQAQRYVVYLIPPAALAAALGWKQWASTRGGWQTIGLPLGLGAVWIALMILVTSKGTTFKDHAANVDAIVAGAAVGLSAIGWLGWAWLRDSFAARRAVAFSALILAGALVALVNDAGRFGLQVKNTAEIHKTIGQWLHAHTPPDATIALNDIGAITFFADRRVIDLEGLVTPDILPYHRGTPGLGEARDRNLERYLDSRGWPDYVAIFPDWHPLIAADARLQQVFEVTLTDNMLGWPQMVVYRVNSKYGLPANAAP